MYNVFTIGIDDRVTRARLPHNLFGNSNYGGKRIMFCNKCGNPIQDDDRFCPFCGSMNTQAKNNPTDPFGYPVAQPPYAAQQPQQQQQQNFSQQVSSSNTYALVGFILSFIFPLLGLIFSIMGLQEANKKNGDRKGFAIAGIIISAVSMIITLIVVIIVWSAALATISAYPYVYYR